MPTGKHPPRKRGAVPSDIPGRLRGGQKLGTGRQFFPTAGSGVPMSSAQAERSVDVPVPWQVRPAQAREINLSGSGTGFNAANTPATIPNTTFTVPPDNVGIIRSVVLSVNNLLPTSNIRWTFRFDANPVEGWTNITIFPRNVAYAAEAFGDGETYIYVPMGATIRVDIEVLDAGTYQAGIAYHGWSYPKRLADQFDTIYAF